MTEAALAQGVWCQQLPSLVGLAWEVAGLVALGQLDLQAHTNEPWPWASCAAAAAQGAACWCRGQHGL